MTKIWRVRLICCGRNDGEYLAETWDEADAFRESYTGRDDVGTIDPHGYSGTGWDGHQRAGIIERMEEIDPSPNADTER